MCSSSAIACQPIASRSPSDRQPIALQAPAPSRPLPLGRAQETLSHAIPNIISVHFNPAGSDNHLSAVVSDVIHKLEKMHRAHKKRIDSDKSLAGAPGAEPSPSPSPRVRPPPSPGGSSKAWAPPTTSKGAIRPTVVKQWSTTTSEPEQAASAAAADDVELAVVDVGMTTQAEDSRLTSIPASP